MPVLSFLAGAACAMTVTAVVILAARFRARLGRRPRGDDAPVHYDVPPDVAEFIVPSFRPGHDTCGISLRYPDIDFVHWRSEAGVTLAFDDGNERLSLQFLGLERPPFADIRVSYARPGKGTQVVLMSDLIGDEETEVDAEVAADLAWIQSARTRAERASSDAAVPVGLPEFSDFDPAVECIEIWVPTLADARAEVVVRALPNGEDSLVLVGGRETALLRGAPDARPHNIRLVAIDGAGWAGAADQAMRGAA